MIDAIVRVSFQTHAESNQAANLALTGHRMGKRPEAKGPFVKHKNTALYHCPDGTDLEVLDAIARFIDAMTEKPEKIDYISITLVRTAPAIAPKQIP